MRALLLALVGLVVFPSLAGAQVRVSRGAGALEAPSVIALGRLGDLRRGRPLGRQHQRRLVDARTRSARPPTTTTPAAPPSRSPAATAPSRPRSTSAAASTRSTWPARAPARTTHGVGDGDFKPGHRLLQRRPAARARRSRCRSSPRRTTSRWSSVLIGANDYGFADIVQTCVTQLVTSPSWWPNYCHDDCDIARMFTAANITAKTDRRSRARSSTSRQAMANAGYADGPYTIMVQTYWSPIPRGSGIRYPQSRLHPPDHRRLRHVEPRRRLGATTPSCTPSTTRCATRSRSRPPTSRSSTCQTRSTAAGCARTRSGCSRRRASRPGQSAGAVDKTEWVHQIRTLTTLFPPYQLQEDAHPNYWGQMAMRNCVRQAYNGGDAARRHVRARHGPQRQRRAEHGAGLETCRSRAIAACGDRSISSSVKRRTV